MNNVTFQDSQLVELARPNSNEPALIQNGNDPGVFSSESMLVERAGPAEANELALIQNGSEPDEFSSSGK
jgi:hypothetical protein